jgi:YD repeat-containing protein
VRPSLNGGTVYASNNLNQYTTLNGIGVAYDRNGNLKSYNGWSYTYDAQNRLKTVLQGTTTVAQYWYNGLNRRITQNMNNVLTFHVWDGWNLIARAVKAPTAILWLALGLALLRDQRTDETPKEDQRDGLCFHSQAD